MPDYPMRVNCAHDKLVPISELVPHPKNPNSHSPEQIDRLAEILRYQGWRRPVRVSTLSSYITAGHGAVEAAKVNGWTEVPVDFQDYDNTDQELADVVADNAIADWAVLDLGFINSEIVPELGPDIPIEMLGIEDFTIEPMDKFEDNDDEEKHKPIRKITCPKCGHLWDANSIED